MRRLALLLRAPFCFLFLFSRGWRRSSSIIPSSKNFAGSLPPPPKPPTGTSCSGGFLPSSWLPSWGRISLLHAMRYYINYMSSCRMLWCDRIQSMVKWIALLIFADRRDPGICTSKTSKRCSVVALVILAVVIDLSIYLSIYLSICLSVCLSVYRSICLSVYLSVCLPVYLSICLSVYLSVYLSIYLSICLSLSLYLSTLSLCLSVYLQAWKRSYSARLPQFLNLTTSKTQQFCETSSIFELDNSTNETILRDFLIFRSWQHQKRKNSARLPWKMESWVQSWRPRTNTFCYLPSPSV